MGGGHGGEQEVGDLGRVEVSERNTGRVTMKVSLQPFLNLSLSYKNGYPLPIIVAGCVCGQFKVGSCTIGGYLQSHLLVVLNVIVVSQVLGEGPRHAQLLQHQPLQDGRPTEAG